MLQSIFKVNPNYKFQDVAILFRALQRQEDKAIQYVQDKIWKSIFSMSRFAGLNEQDAEEILTDSVMVLLQKIQSGDYQFQGYDPCSFAIEIAKRLIANAKRKTKHKIDPLDQIAHFADDSTEQFLHSKESEAILHILLNKIGENCQKLIRLKYLEEYKDEEIIHQNLTQYSSINTLKVKRSECMKKLSELAKNIQT
jgi:RNA polymerase sigma factor (sigma-70 family)